MKSGAWGRICWAASVLFLISACVPIPVLPFGDRPGFRQNIDGTVPAFIVPGQTTRADVLLALGEPDRREADDTSFLYVRETEEGGVAFMVGGGMRGGIIGTPVTVRLLRLTFNRAGVVTDAQAKIGTVRDFGSDLIDKVK